jgi:MFS family permease
MVARTPDPAADRVAGGLAGRLPALAVPTYRTFLLAAFVGNIGAWMGTTAQGWLVLGLTDSAAALGVASAAGSAPVLVLSLLAGVLADRLDRRLIMVGTQVAGALFAAVLATLTMSGVVAYWHVLVLAVLAGSATALAMPTFQAIVSTLVPNGVIGNAVALNSAQFNLSRILGPVAAGVAIAAGGQALAFWVNALALAIVAVVLWRLPLAMSSAATTRAEASMWSNLLDGLRYVRSDRTVLVLLILAAVPGLLMLNYLPLLPVYARDILDIGAGGLGALTAAIGIGALTGALGVAVLRPAGGSGRLLVAGLVVASGALITFALSTWLPLSMLALAVLGAAQVAYYATTNTLLQVIVPPRLRGRVMSLYILTSWGAIPIGNLLAGLLAERFGAPAALAWGGAITLAVAVVVGLVYRPLRRARPERLAVTG